MLCRTPGSTGIASEVQVAPPSVVPTMVTEEEEFSPTAKHCDVEVHTIPESLVIPEGMVDVDHELPPSVDPMT